MTHLKVDKDALLKLDQETEERKTRRERKQEQHESRRNDGRNGFTSISELIMNGASEAEIKKYTTDVQKEQAEEQEEQEMKELEEREKNNLVQLPLWPEAIRGIPNSILRGSLFAAIQSKDAKLCRRKLLNENDRFSLVYTGERLTQSDLDVWETILHLAKDQNLGNKIYYTENSFLKKMGRSTGGKDKQWLKGVLSKLNATGVEITFKDKKTYSFEGSLLSQVYRERDTERFVLVLEPKLHRLFEEGNTWFPWEDRQKIGKRKPLAQWLHGYISSHAKWYPHKVGTLRDYAGSQTKEVREFKKSLKKALEHLLKLDLIKGFHIDEKQLVHIERIGSNSQQKHIENKRAD